jgi:predicted nucleotidyltransferase
MDTRAQRALRDFAAEVRGRFPTARIWAFGSRVRGTHEDLSDLDVCVVVRGLRAAGDRQIRKMSWGLGRKHGLVISAVTYSAEEFEDGPLSESPLVQTVLEEGLSV